jgi:hypothetical protein
MSLNCVTIDVPDQIGSASRQAQLGPKFHKFGRLMVRTDSIKKIRSHLNLTEPQRTACEGPALVQEALAAAPPAYAFAGHFFHDTLFPCQHAAPTFRSFSGPST